MDVPRSAKIPTDERGLPVRNLVAICVLLIGGFVHQLPKETPPVESNAVVLVADTANPFSQIDTSAQTKASPEIRADILKNDLLEYMKERDADSEATESVPTPVPDPVPNSLGSPETDRLRELAEQLTKDAAEIGRRADELKPALSSSYWETGPTAPTACECKCECKCLDEAAMRKIVSDEITYALAAKSTLSNPPVSNGSAGGSVQSGGSSGYSSLPFSNSYSTSSSVSQSWSQPVYSSPSAGGSVTNTASWPLSSTVQTAPNVRDRIASRLASPLQNFAGSKVTIHTFASGQSCPACARWLADVAPKLQADGVLVTQIADITSGTAPQIDVCKDSTSCQRVNGAASYLQIVGMLR